MAVQSFQTSHHSKRNRVVYQRLAIQLSFIIIHVSLIKFAIPSLLWAVLGLLFWGGLIYAAATSGRWVCATFCWLGGIQDLMYRWAKKRVGFSPKITQYTVMVLLFIWVPIAWMISSDAMLATESPINNPFDSQESMLQQSAHFLILMVVGLSVTIFGARGTCHYFCPFGIAVGFFRDRRIRKSNLLREASTKHAASISSSNNFESKKESLPLN